mgnify:CR=1 FL=1
MKRILVSLAVHEEPDVIIDQIDNLKYYLNDPLFILHISKSYFEKFEIEKLQNIENVYINPENLVTKWGNIISTHISNYNYAKKNIEFDYIIFHSSNDMYVRKGAYDYITSYDAGYQLRKVNRNNIHWWPGFTAIKDKQLDKMKNRIGNTILLASQLEGSFYKKEIMDKVIEVINLYYDEKQSKDFYPKEEFYFSTLASVITDWEKLGKPIIFSEIHRFDRLLWKWKDRLRKVSRYSFSKIFGWKIYYKLENYFNNILFKSRFYKISEKDIIKIRENNQDYLLKQNELNDGSGYFKLYDTNNLYGVKRVERNYNDKIRKYIRGLAKG